MSTTEIQQLEAALARKRAIVDPLSAYCPNVPHAKQQKFLDLDTLEAMYGGAGGGGKSDAGLMGALQYANVPGYSALVLRRTTTELEQAEAAMNRAQRWLVGKPGVRWKQAEKVFLFPSGARLQFGFLEVKADRYRYQSAEFQYIFFDELTAFREDDYQFMFSRLRMTEEMKKRGVPLRMRSATNPGGMGHDWVKARFGIPNDVDFEHTYVYKPNEREEPRVFVPARLEDNPAIDIDGYDASLAKVDPITREQMRFGKWLRDGAGLVYKYVEGRNTTRELPMALVKRGPGSHYVLGIDYGFTDSTAFAVLGWLDGDPRVYGIESSKHEGLTPSDAAAKARDIAVYYDVDKIVGDVGGLGKGYAEEARQRFYLPVEPAQKNNKSAYIKLLNGDLARGQVMLHRAMNLELLEEWNLLPWKHDMSGPAPGFRDHIADAFLYAWRACRNFHETTPKRRPEQGTPEWKKAFEDDVLARDEARMEANIRAEKELEMDAEEGWADYE